jgi:pyruvate dehydrogenase E1 component alpha subunit
MSVTREVVVAGTAGHEYSSLLLHEASVGIRTDAFPDRASTESRLPDPGLLVRIYEGMLRARVIDDRMLALQRQGRVGFHVGFRGEEAAIVASTAALHEQDWIFPCYREVAALLWRGFPLQRYVDNMFGNADDVALGRQMPDHVTGKAYGYASVSSPIGTQIMHAVGYAWAAKLRRDGIVTAVYFGDGATSTPDFHTGMNFAGVFKLPTLFLCRNNQWAISVASRKQTASIDYASKAEAYGVRGVQCDGNDAAAVFRTVAEAAERARSGAGPTLVELVTYRLGGHSTSDDPRAYRSDDEVERWNKKDPLVRLCAHLQSIAAWSDEDEQSARERCENELKECIEAAQAKQAPPLASLFDGVYASRPWHLQEQFEACMSAPRGRPEGHGADRRDGK